MISKDPTKKQQTALTISQVSIWKEVSTRTSTSMECIVVQLKTRESSASTLQHPKSEDKIFGEMVIKMIPKIPESEERYLLKLRIQQDIVQMLYSFCRGSQNVPFTPQGMTPSPQSLSDHFP